MSRRCRINRSLGWMLGWLLLLAPAGCSDDDGGSDVDAQIGPDAGAVDAATLPDVLLPTGQFPVPGLLGEPAPSSECEGNSEIFVAAEGADGDGSQGSPRTDWQGAIDAAQPGETLRFGPGTYVFDAGLETARDGASDARICLLAQDPAQRPVFERDPGYDGHLLAVNHAYVVVDGFVVDGQYVVRSANDGHQNLIRIEGAAAILRNSELRRNTRTCLHIEAEDVLVENTEIHHNLRGSFSDQQDAHAISAGQVRNLTLRHLDLHHVTGDCFQVNPDTRYDDGDRLWDQILMEHTRMWTGPMGASDTAGTQWNAGESPGENAVDTKTFTHDANYPTAALRPVLTLRNVAAHDFDANGFISRRSAFNVKHECDWIFDGVTVYNNQFAFRIRGDWESPDNGGARLFIYNLLAFANGTPDAESAVFRVEREITDFTIHHATFFDNERVFRHADNPDGTGWDDATLDVRNCLFEGALPEGVTDASNRVATTADFSDAAGHDFRLASGSGALDACLPLAGSPVTWDVAGNERDAQPDCGAYESVP